MLYDYFSRMQDGYDFCVRVINSASTIDHYDACVHLVNNFIRQNEGSYRNMKRELKRRDRRYFRDSLVEKVNILNEMLDAWNEAYTEEMNIQESISQRLRVEQAISEMYSSMDKERVSKVIGFGKDE